MELRPFNLEQAKAGKPVITRDGRSVRIICFDREGYDATIIGLIKQEVGDKEEIGTWNTSGIYFDVSSPNDLFMAPTKITKWFNIYKDEEHSFRLGTRLGYSTKEAATKGRICSIIENENENYITTIPIEIEV